MSVTILLIFLLFIALGVPIAFAMGLTSVYCFLLRGGVNLDMIPSKMFAGIDVFPYLCIPLFLLTGEIMTSSGITSRLVNFCDNLIGHIRGGLAHVNVLANMLFAGISGSASADAAALGPLEIQMMTEAGYDREFSAGVTAAAAIMGPIIPPSLAMIIYAVVAGNVSVVALFLGGILPGVPIGVSLMLLCYVMSRRRGYPKRDKRVPFMACRSIVETMPALMTPVIIMGGILSGAFTATESAGVAVVYAILVGRFILRTLTWAKLYSCLLKTAKTTAAVMFIIAVASAMGWALTALRIPQEVAQFFLVYANSRILFLLIANVLLLVVGCVLDQAPALLIMVPILLPAAMKFGVDPVHFGLIVVVNLCIGLLTPPVGMVLFVTSNVAQIGLARMYRAVVPFIIVEIAALFIITYVPQFTTFIPKALGY